MTVSVRNESTGGVALVAHPPTVGLLAQFGVLAVLAVGVGFGWPGWLAGAAYALVTWALLTRSLQRLEAQRSGISRLEPQRLEPQRLEPQRLEPQGPETRGWGPADTVTLIRATLVGGVIALVTEATVGGLPTVGGSVTGSGSALAATPAGKLVAVLVTLAAVALVLDAVDGQVARRTGTTSSLGARFDMETDSVLALVLSVFVAGMLGWWVLAIGLARYAFGAAAWAWPWLRAPLPPCRSRKVVAAMQGIVLVVAASGLLPSLLATLMVGSALAALVWSFGRDIAWLAARWSADSSQLAGVSSSSAVGSGAGRSGNAGGATPGWGRVERVG